METFKIPVQWACYGEVTIEANSIEEAIEIAKETIDDIALPTDSEYIDGSFEINDDVHLAKIMNNIKVEELE